MDGTITLKDLKKQNNEEEGVAETPEVETPEEPEVEQAEVAEPEAPEETEEVEEEDGESVEEDPEWLKAEDEAEEDTSFTPDSTAAAIRKKWKGKLQEEKSKNEDLEAQLAEMKQKLEQIEKNPNPQQSKIIQGKPQRDDFNTDEEFFEALTDYKLEIRAAESQSSQAAEQKQRQQQARKEQITKAVDDHYLRAATLAEKSGIKAEAYQAADGQVRAAIDTVFQGAGDAVTDELIASLGEGSEKVFYHLGVNPTKRARFIELFKEDPNGIKAAVFLGRLNAELNIVKKRESAAPPPSEPLHGDKSMSAGEGALKKQYQAAHAKGDLQTAFSIKRKAKKQGIETREW